MAKRISQVRCPICRTPVKRSDPEFPFCSERCRTIDLGKWASGEYVVPTPLPDTEQELQPSRDPGHSDDE